MDVPLESAGFVDMEMFGPVMIGSYFLLIAILAIAVGEIVTKLLLAPPRPRRAVHLGP